MGTLISDPRQLAALQLSEHGSFDILEMYNARNGQEYFMSLPKKYVFRTVLRLSLVSFILALLSYRILIFPIIPCYVIHLFKIRIFTDWCRIVNISPKKMWVFFVVCLILFEIGAVFVRRPILDWLSSTHNLGLYEIQRWFQ